MNQDHEAEVGVLAAMMDSPQAADYAATNLTGLDFTSGANGKMFVIMRTMYRKSGMIEAALLPGLIRDIQDEHTRDSVEGALQSVFKRIPNPAAIEEYCARLKLMAARRKATEESARLQDKASKGQLTPADLMKSARELEAVAGSEIRTGQIGALQAEIEAAKKGERFAVPFPWPELSHATRALLPGTVTVICGNPGASKSLALLQSLWFWHMHEFKCAALMLEDGSTFHMRRATAQVAECADFTNDDWCLKFPDKADAIMAQYEAQLESFGKCLFDLPTGIEPTIEAALDWIEARARDGCRIIAIDPYSMLDTGDRPWVTEKQFVIKAKRIVEDYRVSLVIVTHPTKQAGKHGGITLADMGGGAALSRFTHTAIWFENGDWQQSVERNGVKQPGGMVCFDRKALVLKARNGPGAWRTVALQFNRESLTLTEQGLMEKEAMD
jgi:hypothetical protein